MRDDVNTGIFLMQTYKTSDLTCVQVFIFLPSLSPPPQSLALVEFHYLLNKKRRHVNEKDRNIHAYHIILEYSLRSVFFGPHRFGRRRRRR